MTFFKELETLKRSVLSAKKAAVEGTDEHQAQSYKLGVINRIIAYINDGDWARESARERIMYAIRQGYAAGAEKYGTSVESIKSSVYQSSEKIRSIFGYPAIDILKLLEDGRHEDAEALFEIRTNAAHCKLFPDEVMQHFPAERSIKEVDSAAFIEEVHVLRGLSVAGIESRMSAFSADVLGVIAYILFDNDPAHIQKSVALHRYFLGELDTLELEEAFNIKEEE